MVYVFLADGFEEIEAITVIDILRRANINVKSVGIENESVEGTHKIVIKTDCSLDDVFLEECQGIVLPGGMPGTTNLLNNLTVCNIIKDMNVRGKLIGAICAAPSILGTLGILNGKTACCYPGFESKMKGASVVNKNVCVDGNIITSRGPGTALEFSLEIVGYLCDNNNRHKLQEEIQWPF